MKTTITLSTISCFHIGELIEIGNVRYKVLYSHNYTVVIRRINWLSQLFGYVKYEFFSAYPFLHR